GRARERDPLARSSPASPLARGGFPCAARWGTGSSDPSRFPGWTVVAHDVAWGLLLAARGAFQEAGKGKASQNRADKNCRRPLAGKLSGTCHKLLDAAFLDRRDYTLELFRS